MPSQNPIRTVLWNLEWATPRSARGQYLKSAIEDFNPDLICVTESSSEMLPSNGYTIESDADYGYGLHSRKRKVILWSNEPWTEVDTIGCGSIPGGRYVSGISKGVRVIGVCVPWSRAHVSTGRKDRRPWEDHATYLKGLPAIVERHLKTPVPVCLLGDYNQVIPRHRQPARIFEMLSEVFSKGLSIATNKEKSPRGHPLLDHVATSPTLRFTFDSIHPTQTIKGLRVSDHEGVFGFLDLFDPE